MSYTVRRSSLRYIWFNEVISRSPLSDGTTLAAFLPLIFWPGIAGEFMKYLPITLICVLTSSLFMALLFVPVLGSVLNTISRIVLQIIIPLIFALILFNIISFGIKKNQSHKSIYDVIINNQNIRDCIQSTEIDYLDIVPSNAKLAGAEVELVSMFTRESVLKEALSNINGK